MKNLTSIILCFAFVMNANAINYDNPVESSDKTYTDASNIHFNKGWNSSNDTVDTPALYFQYGTYLVDSLTFSQPTTFYNWRKSTSEISNSTLSLKEHLYVRDTSSLLLKDCNTKLNSSKMSQIGDASSMVVEGGSFTVSASNPDNLQGFSVEAGSSLTFKNTQVDFTGGKLQTSTASTFYKDYSAKITVDNSTLKTGYIDLYGYESAGKLPEFNVINGSNVTASFTHTYYGIVDYDSEKGEFIYAEKTTYVRGGTINVSGENTVLNIVGDLKQQNDNGSQVYTTKINLNEGAKLDVDGALDTSSVNVKDASLIAKEIIVGEGRTFDIAGNSSIESELLTVFETSSVSIEDSVNLTLDSLNIVLSELAEGTEFDLSSIFGDNTSVVLSAVNNNIIMSDADGNMYDVVLDGNKITAGNVIPEPSTYAAILGALALAFAAYRRRK